MFGQHCIFEGEDEISLTITITTMGVMTSGAGDYPMKVLPPFLYFLPLPQGQGASRWGLWWISDYHG